jgi:hypothetical protein
VRVFKGKRKKEIEKGKGKTKVDSKVKSNG